MTKNETIQIIMMIQATYPQWDVQDKQYTVNMWQKIFEEEEYRVVEQALMAYIRSDIKGFAPVPGQLMEKIQFITKPKQMNEVEAWSLVSKALKRCGYYADEEFEKLPKLVQKAVGSPSQLRTWAIDKNYNEQVASSNFMRSYREEVRNETLFNKMSLSIRNAITDNRNVGMIEEKG